MASRRIGIVLAALTLAGCCPEEKRDQAIAAVDKAFMGAFERTLAEEGTQIFKTDLPTAFGVLRRALAEHGFSVISEDADLGLMSLSAPAPAPLSHDEWLDTRAQDLPQFRKIICQVCGAPACWMADFSLQGVSVLIDVGAIENRPYTELTVSMRLEFETRRAPDGSLRRLYPPPETFRRGLRKFWATFRRDLAAG